jgi:hypothetical protein
MYIVGGNTLDERDDEPMREWTLAVSMVPAALAAERLVADS